MLKGMVDSIATGLASGGTVDGDLVVTGDFKVEGAGSFAFDEIIEGTFQLTNGSSGFNTSFDESSAVEKRGIYFNSTANRGIHFKAGNASSDFSVQDSSGNVVLFVDNGNDRVGINITSPSNTLHVSDSAEVTAKITSSNSIGTQLSLDADGTGGGEWKLVSGANGAGIGGGSFGIFNNAYRFNITSTGEVGIGTSSPSEKLTISANDGTILLQSADVNNSTFIRLAENGFQGGYLKYDGTNNKFIIGTHNATGTTVSNDIPVMTFLRDGTAVGIGTESPSQLLHIEGTSFPTALITGGSSTGASLHLKGINNSTVQFDDNTGTKWFLRYQPGADKIDFFNNGLSSSALTILDSNNKIGIGTDSPYYQTDIRFANTNTSFSGGSNGAWGGNGLRIENTSSTADTMSAIHLRNYDADIHIASIYNSTNNSTLGIFFEGNARMKLDDNSRISLSNNDSGTDNTLFGKLAGSSIASGGNYNVALGSLALQTHTTGDRNIAIGYASMNNTDAGSTSLASSDNVFIGYGTGSGTWTNTNIAGNVGIGSFVLDSALDGALYNTALGYSALSGITTADNMVAIGTGALQEQTTGQGNIAIGRASMNVHGTGSYNTAIGNFAMDDTNAGSTSAGSEHNIFIGNSAGGGTWANTASNKNIGIGNYAMEASLDGITGIVAIGHQSLNALTSGNRTTAIGYQAGQTATTIDYTTVVGYQAGLKLLDSTHNTLVGYVAGYSLGSDQADNNTFMGAGAGANGDYSTTNNNTANNNVGIGKSSMGGSQGSGSSYNFTATNNVGVGVDTLKVITSGSNNTALGYQTLKNVTTGGTNVALGADSAFSLTTQNTNVIIGASSGYSITGSNSIENVIIGGYAGTGGSGDLKRVVAIGKNALNSTGSNNFEGEVAIGYNALTALTTGTNNTAIGYEALQTNADSDFNTAIGYQALRSHDRNGTANNTALGYKAGYAVTTSFDSTLLGSNAGVALTTGNGNTAVGSNVMASMTTGDNNTAVGVQALNTEDVGRGTTAIGYQALFSQNSDSNDENTGNTALGYHAGYDTTTGTNNTYLGYEAGKLMTTAIGATSIGAFSLDANVGGGEVVSIGYQSLTDESFAGQVVAIGYQALKSQNKGANSYNTAIGSQVGRNITNGEHNNLAGYRAGETLTTGDENILIGSSSDVSTADAQNQIVIGKGATGVQNNSAIIGNSSCADVFMGDNGSAWSTTSDGRLKENVEDWNVGLDAINNLRIVSYNFKKDNPYKYNSDKKRQGIIAQEAQKVLPEMIKDDGEWLSANQEPMIWALVNAVQELSTQVNNLKKQLKDK